MAPEKTKPGVVNALSRILHLHQLPDSPPTAGEKPTIVLNRAPAPIESSKSMPVSAIPPAYAGKPFILPEARSNSFTPIPPIDASPTVSPTTKPMGSAPSLSPTRVTPIEKKSIAAPASSAIAPAMTKPLASVSSSPPNPWPFPAPWIKSTAPTPSGKPPTAPLRNAPSSTPASSEKKSTTIPPVVPARPPAMAVSSAPAASGAMPARFPSPVAPLSSGSPSLASSPARETAYAAGSPLIVGESIVTNFDRILDIVKLQKSIKLDELTKRIGMPEEKVAEELQTLEDNGLIEVRYPAFGEPIIYYKG